MGREPRHETCEGAGAVTEPVLHLRAELREGLIAALRDEERIVSKARIPPGLGQEPSLHRTIEVRELFAAARHRFWCRYFCPTGLWLQLLGRMRSRNPFD